MNMPRIDKLDAEFRHLIDAGEFAGIASEAWHGDRLAHRSALGIGSLTNGAPMSPDTIVRIFSMTKPVTAVAMMMLHDEGLFQFDDPIARHLPEFTELQVLDGFCDDGRPILRAPRTQPTIQHLLTHSAGFTYSFDPGWLEDRYREADLWGSRDLNDFVERLSTLPLAFEPGTRWHYGVSMDVQGALVERLSGVPFADFVENRILAPLGMIDTAFHVPSDKLDRIASLYQGAGDNRKTALNPVGDSLGSRPKLAIGGGGLYSTVVDFARFGRMLLGGGMLDGKRIVSKPGVRSIMSEQIPASFLNQNFGAGSYRFRPGFTFGYNGAVVSDPSLAEVALGRGSYMWDGLASTWFWVDPQNEMVFVGAAQRISGPEVPCLPPLTHGLSGL